MSLHRQVGNQFGILDQLFFHIKGFTSSLLPSAKEMATTSKKGSASTLY